MSLSGRAVRLRRSSSDARNEWMAAALASSSRRMFADGSNRSVHPGALRMNRRRGRNTSQG
jgi:hypothetical protein